jgi:hypothetical protein
LRRGRHVAPYNMGPREKPMLQLAPDRKRRADRERQRRCRALRRQGRAAYTVVIDGDVIGMLVALGWLRDADATDPQCVARAIGALLADAAKKSRHA